jgi:hypothetical protein
MAGAASLDQKTWDAARTSTVPPAVAAGNKA